MADDQKDLQVLIGSIYFPGFYNDLLRNGLEAVKKHIESEGFHPLIIHNLAGYTYNPHHHPETKLLAFLEGNMVVTVDNIAINCKPGDKVIIPGNIDHDGIVGPDGCRFFWSEKII